MDGHRKGFGIMDELEILYLTTGVLFSILCNHIWNEDIKTNKPLKRIVISIGLVFFWPIFIAIAIIFFFFDDTTPTNNNRW